MTIAKQQLKSKPVCKVTFKVPKTAANGAEQIHVVGEFNDWNPSATPMKKLKNGSFTATVELSPRRDYQFRYLYDDGVWENDWEADRYVYSDFSGCDNSVVAV